MTCAGPWREEGLGERGAEGGSSMGEADKIPGCRDGTTYNPNDTHNNNKQQQNKMESHVHITPIRPLLHNPTAV